MNAPTVPLPLPQFTFLLAAAGNGQDDLAAAIAALDDELLVEDLEKPLRLATEALFFGSIYDVEWTGDTNLSPFDVAAADWLRNFEHFLKLQANFGPSVLANLAIHEYQQESRADFFHRTLYRDARMACEVEAFANIFEPNACLTIHVGPITAQLSPIGRNIWLPNGTTDVDERIAFLSHELTLVR
jgi:hypothetical protein